MHATYAEAVAAIKDINERAYALVCPRVKTEADIPAYTAWQEAVKVLYAEASSHGFIRLFDGSYRLDVAKYKDAPK